MLRGGGGILPLVLLGFLACTSREVSDTVWSLPQEEDPLGVVPVGTEFRVAYRDGQVFQGPPWREVLRLPPGLRMESAQEGGFFWITRDRRRVLRVVPPRVETLLAIPDTSPSTIRRVVQAGEVLLLVLSSRLLLYHRDRWWTLPFLGQTASLRLRDGGIEVVWAIQGAVIRSLSPDGGARWTRPETLLIFPYPVLDLRLLSRGMLLGWSPMPGPPTAYVYVHPPDTPRLVWGGGRPLVGTHALEKGKRLLVFATSPADTGGKPGGVRLRVLDLPSKRVSLDTLAIRGLWLYDLEVRGRHVEILAAGRGEVVRKVLKLPR